MAEVNVKEPAKENIIKTKVRKVCSIFWRFCFIFIPAIMLPLFGVGYYSNYNHVLDNTDLYSDLTDEMIRKIAQRSGVTGGLFLALFYTAATLLVIFVITVLSAKKKTDLSIEEKRALKKLSIARLVFLAPFAISIVICLVSGITGISSSFMGVNTIDYGFDAIAWVAIGLGYYFWWLYIICFIGIIVTSIIIIKKNKG